MLAAFLMAPLVPCEQLIFRSSLKLPAGLTRQPVLPSRARRFNQLGFYEDLHRGLRGEKICLISYFKTFRTE